MRPFLIAAAVLAAGPAAAAPITFDLTGSPAAVLGTTQAFTVSGLTLTAAGFTQPAGPAANPPFTLTPRTLTQNANGLGVGTVATSQLDGSGTSEVLRLTFDRPVTLNSVRFTEIDAAANDDTFDMAIDGVNVRVDPTFPTNVLTNGAAFPGGVANFDPTGGVIFTNTNVRVPAVGTEFLFFVNDANDDYRIASIRVTPLDRSVPEPGTLAALGLMAVGGAVARRRVSRR